MKHLRKLKGKRSSEAVARTEFTSRLLYSKIINAMREILKIDAHSQSRRQSCIFVTSLRATFPCQTLVHKCENVNHSKSLQSQAQNSGIF